MGARRPGRERRRGRRRRRHRRRHPHREPQPPVGHRAVPGRGHRRRRHPPRHLHDGRPPDRADGPAALRSARRPPQPLDRRRASCRASPATATRSACRPSAARSCSTRRYAGQPARQRAVPRRAARSTGSCSARPRASATWPCCSARRTGRDGIGGVSVLASAGFGDDEADAAKRPERAGRRPVRGEAADRGLPRAARRRPRRRHPGPRRRRAHLRHQRDGRRGRRGHGRRRRPRCPGASRAWSRSR